jgi:polar amino acid transport system ATP-binding protein
MIIVKKLNKKIGVLHILNDISLEIKQSEITVLFGPSGCGKTTLLRNISLLDIPDSGQITLFGKIYSFPSKIKVFAPYPKLTIVFQQLFLWPHLTNRQNILLAVEKKNYDYSERLNYLDELIAEIEMQSYIDKYPNQSSLGQKQRVAIARALILKPEFIFFDEITASLDILQVNNILQILLSIIKNKVGILFITHNIDIAKKIGNQFLFMNNGKIVEAGNIEILSNPKTKDLIHFLNSPRL